MSAVGLVAVRADLLLLQGTDAPFAAEAAVSRGSVGCGLASPGLA
jgi:hypothetical protein